MKKLMACLILALFSCPLATVSNEPVEASLFALIATPNAFEGKFVRVIGYIRLEFEGTALYVHEADYLHGLTINGLWIEVNSELVPNRDELNGKYVIVEGKFRSNAQGHLGGWNGSITEIRRCNFWSDPNNPRIDRQKDIMKRMRER